MSRESFPPPSESGARERSGPEGGLAEILKRMIESGARNLAPEGIRQAARDLKLPREAISFAFSQLDETKSGLYRAVAGELRQFLEGSNLGDELARALTKLTFEVKMQVRFVASENQTRPKVATSVRVRSSNEEPPEEAAPAPAAEAAKDRTAAAQTMEPNSPAGPAVSPPSAVEA